MPEGDTIHRTAMRLRKYVPQQPIVAVRSPRALVDIASLAGHNIVDVEARGKHLLMQIDDGRVIHGHSGMTGSWHVYAHGQAWHKPESRAGLVLELPAVVVVFFSPKQLEVLSPDAFRRHRYLHRLGPDLLASQIDIDQVVVRFRRHNATPLGVAVMNQTICCGIGNVYKSELLFLEKLDPFAPVAVVDDASLGELLQLARELMQFNLQGPRRTTRTEGDGGRLWVYGRRGEPCYLCGCTIHLTRQGDAGRTTYWCPECQPPAPGYELSRPARADAVHRRRPPIKGCG